MMPHDPPRMCTTCAIPHVENCGTCWGFGTYEAQRVPGFVMPVNGAEAHGDWPPRGRVVICPMCGGGASNVPAARPV